MKFPGLTLSLLLFCPLWAVAAGTPPPPPAAPSEMNWTPRPVPFSHAGHRAGPDSARERCAACHHPVQEEIPYLTCASKGCHDNLDRRNTGPNSYYLAVHQTPRGRHRSCVSCHEEHAGDDLARLKKLAGCEESVCHP